MKISIITGPFLSVPPAPHGAVERIWQELAEEFALIGHEVSIISKGHGNGNKKEKIAGVQYLWCMQLSRTDKIYFDLIKDLIYSIRSMMLLQKSQVVVTNSFWLPILIAIIRPNIGKVVVNVARVPKGQLRYYWRVSRLAVVSNAIRNEISNQCPELLGLVKVIANPVDTGIFKPPAIPRENSAVRVILYAGRVHPEKGIHLLVEAFSIIKKSFSNVTLRILGATRIELGGGGSKYLKDLRRRASGLPVDFDGPIYNKLELAKAYQSAHLFCYPSLSDKGESFGLAPLEAMATGLVPIVSELECFSDFIKDGDTGFFFDHRSADAVGLLANMIAKLLSDSETLSSVGSRAAKKALQFGREEIAAKYLRDFAELSKECR